MAKLLRCHLFAATLLCATLLGGCGGGTTFSTGNPPVSGSSLIATTTTLAASQNPASAGVPLTFNATVTASTGSPSGTVTFTDGGTVLGTGTLASGVATLTLRSFTAGTTHSVTAAYAGTTTLAPSTSAAVALVVAAPAVPSAINVHATFSTATPHQTILGFGGSEAFYQTYLDQHPASAEINKALFDPATGLGLNFLRLQNSYYQFNGANATTFDPDNAKLESAANAAHGSAVTLLMSSWTPPVALKSNQSVNGCTTVTNGSCTGGIGTLNQVNGAYNYAGFAQYWSDSLAAYAALGVKPDYISIQNEPDFAATYVGCRFNPTEAPVTAFGVTTSYASYGMAFDAVYKKLNAGGATSAPKMVGPETFSTENAPGFAAQLPAGEVAAYAHHRYNVSSGGLPSGNTYTIGGNPDNGLAADAALAAAFPSALKFQTEYYQAPGSYAAWDIHNAFTVANDNVYLYWALAWPSTVVSGQAVDQAGLIYVDNPGTPTAWQTKSGWSLNDAYYAFRHFSGFVKPGYVRYDGTLDNTNERVSVYASADGKTTVIVLLNTSANATDGVQLNLAPFPYTSATVYRSSFTTAADTGERFANLGAYPATGVNLPPQSVVTVVLNN